MLGQAGYVTFHSGKAGNACRFGNAAFTTNIETKSRNASSATEHADNAIAFLAKHDVRKPFFLYLAPPVPHGQAAGLVNPPGGNVWLEDS